MANKYATFEVRQGDTFHENLIMEDSSTSTAVDLTNSVITAHAMFPTQNVELDVAISNALTGSFSITKSAADTMTWPLQDAEGYITITEAGVKTSSDNFTIKVIRGAI